MSDCKDDCNCKPKCDCNRVAAIDSFSRDIQNDPRTRENLDRIGQLIAQIRDIVLSDGNIADSIWQDKSLEIIASCPNSTELIVVDIRMISQLPYHELEMMNEI